jgi:hypothetical protein
MMASGGDAVATQSDLLTRAAECEHLMNLATDRGKKESFRLLRYMWIMLANESPNLPSDVIAEDVSAIYTMQRFLADSLGDSQDGSIH